MIRPRSDLTFLKVEPTPKFVPAVATAPKKVDDSQLTKTRAGRIRRSRKRTSASRSRSLFKRVTTAIEAEGPSPCITTKPDIANVNTNTNINTDTANVADPKINATPMITPAPSDTPSSQDDTSRRASPLELDSSGTPVYNSITTDTSIRTTRTPRPWPRRLPANALHAQEIDNGRYGGSGRMRRCGTFRHIDWLRDHLEEEEEEDE